MTILHGHLLLHKFPTLFDFRFNSQCQALCQSDLLPIFRLWILELYWWTHQSGALHCLGPAGQGRLFNLVMPIFILIQPQILDQLLLLIQVSFLLSARFASLCQHLELKTCIAFQWNGLKHLTRMEVGHRAVGITLAI